MKFDTQICEQYLQGQLANCAANCPGVDPNSIIGGGVAAVAITATAGQAFLGPALGLGALGVAGAGGAAAAMGMFSQCPRSRPCRVRGIYRVTALSFIFAEAGSLCSSAGHQREEALSLIVLNHCS